MGFFHQYHRERKRRSWPDLPEHLLAIIAVQLGIMELLNFRKACPEFRNAAFTATAKIESTPSRLPWLLIFGQTSSDYSLLFDQKHKKKYFANIPELVGSNCLTSYKGWLLLYQKQSMFLYCPFSSAKISLPNFPHSEISNHIAALSSEPTAANWAIAVINRHDMSTFELNVIGPHEQTMWTTHSYMCNPIVGRITGATFHCGIFYFLDSKDLLVTFKLQDSSWKTYRLLDIADRRKNHNVRGCIPFYSSKESFLNVTDNNGTNANETDTSWMDLKDDVMVRGTTILTTRGKEWCNHDERIRGICEEENGSKLLHLKGVWIQPRFHQLSKEII